MVIPVVITVYQDKSFTFITKSPPASVLLKKAAGITAGSKEPNKEKVGKVTRKQILDIIKIKKDTSTRLPRKPLSASSPAPPAAWASRSSAE